MLTHGWRKGYRSEGRGVWRGNGFGSGTLEVGNIFPIYSEGTRSVGWGDRAIVEEVVAKNPLEGLFRRTA